MKGPKYWVSFLPQMCIVFFLLSSLSLCHILQQKHILPFPQLNWGTKARLGPNPTAGPRGHSHLSLEDNELGDHGKKGGTRWASVQINSLNPHWFYVFVPLPSDGEYKNPDSSEPLKTKELWWLDSIIITQVSLETEAGSQAWRSVLEY